MVAVASAALAGCGTLGNLHIVNPTYSLQDVRPHVNLGIPPSIDFDFTIGVDNPNAVALRLDHFDFDLLINDNLVLNDVRSDQGVRIPAQGIGNVQLRTHVTQNGLQSIYRQIVSIVQGNRATYTIRGNAWYDTPVGTLRFPVTVNFH